VIVNRYLTREVVNALLAVTVVLLMAFLCQQMVRYLNYVAIGKIPTDVLLQLVGFEVPYLLALLLPLGLYLGILFAYGRLYADNEMLILQMCGFGNRRLMRLSVFIAVVVSLIVLFLMLWVNPWVSGKRQQMMASDEATIHLVQTLIPGRFQASPDGRHVMYVEKLSRDRQRAQNVFLAQEKKNPKVEGEGGQRTWMLVLANEGYQEKDKETNDQLFVTADGYRYEGIPGENDYKIIQFKKYKDRIPQNEVRSTHEELETLSNTELLREYNVPKKAGEFQWRVSIGISAFLLALLAVPLSAVRPRRGRYLTFLPAILIYIIYFNLLYIARHWVDIGSVPVTIGMWWVHGVMLLIIASVLFFNAKQWR
jgi:lipopolysaccharide export system permease protein